jgi:hypothetical protein
MFVPHFLKPSYATVVQGNIRDHCRKPPAVYRSIREPYVNINQGANNLHEPIFICALVALSIVIARVRCLDLWSGSRRFELSNDVVRNRETQPIDI